eukprot:103159_1
MSTSMMRTCQRCHTQFDITSNTNISCEFHRSSHGSKLWGCCGRTLYGSKACAMGKHVTYDDKWNKFDDFFVKPIARIMREDKGSWIYHPQLGYVNVKWDESDPLKAIPAAIHSKPADDESEPSELVDMNGMIDICRKCNGQKLSDAVYEIQKKLPFAKVTSHLVAKMIVIDLLTSNKLHGIELTNDLDDIDKNKEDQVAGHLIANMSSSTLAKLAEIL